MKLTRSSHSCVRLEQDGRVLVIDPGIWSEPRALRGADAVLVTHEHVDHVDVLRLVGAGLPVFAPDGAIIHGLTTVSVRPDEELEVAGFHVQAVGGRHAAVVEDQETCANLGYVVDGLLYHPGDALHIPATHCTSRRRLSRRSSSRSRRRGSRRRKLLPSSAR